MLQSESGRARLLERLAAAQKDKQEAAEKDCHSNSPNPAPAISADAKEANNNVTPETTRLNEKV